MDYDTYRKQFFVDPMPTQRFKFAGLQGAALYFSDYVEAITYYQHVLGPPAYVEGEDTRGWQIGNTWLTLLKGETGSPKNIEMVFVMSSLQEAERLQAAFFKKWIGKIMGNFKINAYPLLLLIVLLVMVLCALSVNIQ